MLRARVISAFVLGIPALLAVIAGGWWYAAVLMLVLGLAAIEFTQLVARRGHRAFGGLLLVWVAVFLLDRLFPDHHLMEPGMAILLLATIAWALIRYTQGTVNAVMGLSLTVLAGLFLGWSGAHFLGVRSLDNGLFWMLAVILAVWATDSASYFVGSAVGRTRMNTAISPGKTWEGYVGGIAGGLLGMVVFVALWQATGSDSPAPLVNVLGVGLIASIVGPLGDFAISALKRYAGVKDSSHLIPGHGGMLDRIDTLLVTGLLSYYYLSFIVLSGG